MRRLLTLFMVFALVIANSAAFAAAVCRHAGVADHEAARKSEDARIAGVALSEEAADSVASKKGAVADAGAVAWVADLSPGAQLTVPDVATRTVDAEMALARPLIGRSLAPLLEPPAA
jgi:hypothetical protein